MIFLLFSLQAYAATDSVYLQTKLNAIKTMRADFIERVQAKKTAATKSSGKMALVKPKQFFWKTLKPMPQLVVADGKHLWIYDEELEQVSVRRQGKNLRGAAAIFLSENTNIAKDYEVSFTKRADLEAFDLRSKSSKNTSFSRVGLVFLGEKLQQIDLYDELGQHTQVSFTNVKLNAKLSSRLFKFIVPKGTDVVQQ